MTIPDQNEITAAAHRIASHIHHTPVFTNQTINSITGNTIWFKCENLQKAGAFKTRGATNALLQLSPQEKINGVATHSSGNHAGALARAAGLLNIKSHIVMPENSSNVKVEAVKHYGGRLTFCDNTLKSREETLNKIISDTGATVIHPYNDINIICGQATAAMESFKQVHGADIIMTPVGGGGLLSGTALAAKYYADSIKVIGCEPEQANDAYQSFISGSYIPATSTNTIADGLRTSLGDITWPIIKELVDDIITVSEADIIKAMRLVWSRMKLIIEPSSAVPLATLLNHTTNHKIKNKTIIIILSGGNVDFNHLPW